MATWVSLTDTPGAITADQFVRGNSLGTLLQFTVNPVQEAYDVVSGSVPHRTVVNGSPFTVDLASGTGAIWRARNTANVITAELGSEEHSFGETGKRLAIHALLSSDRPSIELWPDSMVQTAASALAGMLQWDGTLRTTFVSSSIGSGFNLTGVFEQEQSGFAFNNGNIFVHGTTYQNASGFAANFGSFFTLVDQPLIRAQGTARTGIIYNAVRGQPRFGPHLAGGSLTWTAVTLYESAGTVTAGSVITTWRCFRAAGQATGGGAIGTWIGLDIVDPTTPNPATVRGIRCSIPADASHRFIEHTGTALSSFAGGVHMNNGIPLSLGSIGSSRVDLLRPAGGTLRMITVGGANNEGLDFDLDNPNNCRITSSTGASLNIDTIEFAFGPGVTADGTNNWVMAFAPGLRATQLAGDYSEVLFTSSTAITIAHAIGTFATWTVNFPTVVLGAGTITNAANVLIQTNPNQGSNDRAGLRITTNPSGGAGVNAALHITAGLARFDGRVDINNGIALGGGAAATLGTIGGAGPTVAAQAQWVEIDIAGVAHWIPVWI